MRECNYLCKFRLSVVSSSFVSVTPSNLEVSVKTTHHEKLLELLRTLHQRIEFTWLSRRYYEFLSTLNIINKSDIFTTNLYRFSIKKRTPGVCLKSVGVSISTKLHSLIKNSLIFITN